jgi:hypothetical protein
MRKILVISLIAVHLFGNTELGQALKLPNLISHYFQHHRQDPGINFLEFLAMHYGGDDGTTADDDKDNQLPYQNADNHCLCGVYSPMVQNTFSLEPIEYGNPEYGSRLQTGNSSEHVLQIFQPPRKI